MALKARKARAASKQPTSRDIGSRWTPALAKAGWTPVSDVFLEHYTHLTPAISTPEAMLIIQIMRHKWNADLPYPSFRRLAARMGISDTAARGHARSLERKKYLTRIKRVGKPNQFDLKPLFEALEAHQATMPNRKAVIEEVDDTDEEEEEA